MRRDTAPNRTLEESCAYLDQIVGRCVMDAQFAAAVLEDPDRALAAYELTEDELDDFRALKNRYRDGTSRAWERLRADLEAVRKRHAQERV
jgi:hypothetical protein